MKMLDTANEFVLYHFDRIAKPYHSLIPDGCFIGKPKREFICLTKFMFLFEDGPFLIDTLTQRLGSITFDQYINSIHNIC